MTLFSPARLPSPLQLPPNDGNEDEDEEDDDEAYPLSEFIHPSIHIHTFCALLLRCCRVRQI